jgi:hypothetical protein
MENLAHGFFAETETTRDPSITPFFGFEAKDRAVALGDSCG